MAQLVKLIESLPLPIVSPNLKIGREIDRGAWGTVHEGQLDGQSVAVKKLHQLIKDTEGGDKAVHRFFEECERLKELEHPHVIKFLGAFKDAELGPILVMERMNEALRKFLERRKGTLTIQEQIRISLEITRGVAFLHQLNPPMVHRDLNDKNVMFSFEGVAKIGDFGQSKLKQDLYLTSDHPGMVSFMPPEALGDGNSKYDESLDIFSLGVLMLEIGTQQPPIVNMLAIGTDPEIKRREKDLQKMGDLHPLKPFILLCLSDGKKQRPKATQMDIVLSRLDVNMLQTMLTAEQRLCNMETRLSTLQESLIQAQEEIESKKQHEQMLIQELLEKLALEKKLEEELDAEKKAKHELAEMRELLQFQLKTYEEDFNAERRDRESAHGKFVHKEKEWMDQLEKLTQEHERLTGSEMTLRDQLVTEKREHAYMRKEKELFEKLSKMDRRTSLKEAFGTIVRKKDDEILMQIDEIKKLRQQVELLSEKCCRAQALEIENAQLRETYCLPDEEEPFLEHSGEDSAADSAEYVSFEQPLSITSMHSMGHPKHASSYIMVESQHRQQHHDELQTRLLEADKQQDVAAPMPVEDLAIKGEMEYSEAEQLGTAYKSNHSSAKASSHACPV